MLLANVGVVLGLMSLVWVWSVIRRDVSVVDPFWSVAYLLAVANSVLWTGVTPAKLLILAVVGLWALRLWGWLTWRSIGKGEDPRYTAFRQRFGPERYWWFSFFQVFMLQGGLVLLVTAPLQLAGAAPPPDEIGALDVLAAVIALAGTAIEAVADWQLERFKRRPNRRPVMDEGLWRYSRHPNYFGEILVAWGFFLFALDQPAGIATLFGPILMTFLLVRVSGVALLDEHMAARKPEYREYMRRTRALVPGPRRD